MLLLLSSKDVLRSVERGVENGVKQSSSAFSERYATRCWIGNGEVWGLFEQRFAEYAFIRL